jgi:hypothetical protein
VLEPDRNCYGGANLSQFDPKRTSLSSNYRCLVVVPLHRTPCDDCGRDQCGVVLAGIYFLDAKLASAFVARWCTRYKVETTEGVFRVREVAPEQRVIKPLHRTP